MRHEWIEARRAFPGSEVTPTEPVAWAADQAGLWMDRELIGFPEAGREILRCVERERRLREAARAYLNSDGSGGRYDAREMIEAREALRALLKEEA